MISNLKLLLEQYSVRIESLEEQIVEYECAVWILTTETSAMSVWTTRTGAYECIDSCHRCAYTYVHISGAGFIAICGTGEI